jgi:hypothetical protein
VEMTAIDPRAQATSTLLRWPITCVLSGRLRAKCAGQNSARGRSSQLHA